MKCEKHKIEMIRPDCHRCRGNGYTDSDIEDMDNPIEWHNSGDCWQCKGSGAAPWLVCEFCEEDEREEHEG